MRSLAMISGACVAAFWAAHTGTARRQLPEQDEWLRAFTVDKGDLVSTGRHPFFVLEPGYQLLLADRDTRLTITVLPDTELVDGVWTRVVEERETRGAQLVEVSRNFFAIDRRTSDVYYFGEDVDEYTAGRVASHEGSWRAGIGGAHFGLMMSSTVRKYYQELAPGVAMDRAAVLRDDVTVVTPAGTFTRCRKTEETTPLEPGVTEYKFYAAGVGLIQDGALKLVRLPRR